MNRGPPIGSGGEASPGEQATTRIASACGSYREQRVPASDVRRACAIYIIIEIRHGKPSLIISINSETRRESAARPSITASHHRESLLASLDSRAAGDIELRRSGA